MENNEIIFNKTMQGKFYYFVSKITKGLHKREKKFVRDIVRGIIITKTTVLRKIAQSFQENISLDKVIKRLIYHLDKEELIKNLENNLFHYKSYYLNKHKLFIVDPNDTLKKHFNKPKKKSKLKEGAKGSWLNRYQTIEIISADKKEKDKYSLNILATELFSDKIQIDSLKKVILKKIADVITASNNKCIFVFDKDFGNKKFYRFFKDNDSSFIMRVMEKQDIYYKEKKIGLKKLAKEVKLSYSFNIKGDMFNAGIIDVEIQLNFQSHNKNLEFSSAKLFVGKYNDGKYLYILFSLPNHKDLSKKEITEFVFNAYRLREKVKEIHRNLKKEYQWENIQLGTYKRLKAFIVILSIVANFIYELNPIKEQFIPAIPISDERNEK